MASLIGKSRKPRFELHLKIYDLNNVPLVSGASSVKWHLPHSIHGEHRGRTRKRPIANHRVEYGYSKIVPVRLVIDRSNRLADCPIEFEITQEFENHGGGRDEKILLGKISLNLAEYVVESEAILREGRNSTSLARVAAAGGLDLGGKEGLVGSGAWHHTRNRSSLSTTALSASGTSPGSVDTAGTGVNESVAGSSSGSVNTPDAPPVEDGVIRRYLMQDSRVNSTLKIGILMIQVDGERTFVAPPLKSAPMFGAIAGIVANRDVMGDSIATDDLEDGTSPGSFGKTRDTTEIQDVYRRALAASWACQCGELPADECIEDIFRGGDGFRASASSEGLGSGAAQSVLSPSISGAPRVRTGMPQIGGSLGPVLEGAGWPASSPTESPHDDDSASSPGSAAAGAAQQPKKKASRILPRLGPIRRKTLPAHLGSAKESNSDLIVENNSEHTTTSSGEDEVSLMERDATLRPRDFQKLRQPAASLIYPSSSLPAPANLHLGSHEDSSISDRTSTPPRPGSSRSSPGPQGFYTASPTLMRRDDSHGSGLGSIASASPLRPGSARSGDGSRVSSSHGGRRHGSGNGHETRQQWVAEVNEHDVRADFVAWQLPGSIAATP